MSVLSLSLSIKCIYDTCCSRRREIHNERMIKERKQANWFADWRRNQSTVYCTLYISSHVMHHRTMTCPIPLYSLLCIPILSWHITLYRIAIAGGLMLSEGFKSWHLAPAYHSCSEYGRTSSLSYRSTRTIQHRILGFLLYLLLISERHNDKCCMTTESCINRIVLITKISYLLLSWNPDGIEKWTEKIPKDFIEVNFLARDQGEFSSIFEVVQTKCIVERTPSLSLSLSSSSIEDSLRDSDR